VVSPSARPAASPAASAANGLGTDASPSQPADTPCALPRGGVRSTRERIVQTLWFETIGLLLIAPLYAAVAGAGLRESFAMVAVVSVVVMAWSAVYNTLFDLMDLRWTGRVASQRPHRIRALHALGHELSAIVVTWPVIVAMTSLTWGEALVADLGLTLAYTAYAYVFHLVFDRLRPVRPPQPPGQPPGQSA
jgi:uncharacterized membrane protein